MRDKRQLLMDELASMKWFAADRLPIDIQTHTRLFVYNNKLINGPDPDALLSTSTKETNPTVLYIHIKTFSHTGYILHFAIAKLSEFEFSRRDDGSLRVKTYEFGFNTPQKNKKVLAVMRLHITHNKDELTKCGILARGVSPSVHQKGVMKILSVNVLQALYDIFGETIVTSSPVHIATALFFALDDTQREKMKALADAKTGRIKYGQVDATQPISALLKYHRSRLALAAETKPVSAAIAIGTFADTRAAVSACEEKPGSLPSASKSCA